MSQMIERPFVTLCVMGGIVVGLAGLLMHTIERDDVNELLIYDGPWYVAVSQLTVGYGDIVAMTDIGRFLAISAGGLGVITLALVVTFAFRELSLNREEKIMVEMMYNKLYRQRHFKELACTYIQRKWRLQLARKFNSPNRLKLIVKMQEIHFFFKKKFAKALKVTPELEDQIRIFNSKVFKALAETRKKFMIMKNFSSLADQLSISQLHMTSRLLSVKRAYLRMIFHKSLSWRRTSRFGRHQSQRRRNSIISKKESDMARKRMIERRLQERSETAFMSGNFLGLGRRSFRQETVAGSLNCF